MIFSSDIGICAFSPRKKIVDAKSSTCGFELSKQSQYFNQKIKNGKMAVAKNLTVDDVEKLSMNDRIDKANA